jgi:putative endonuclease
MYLVYIIYSSKLDRYYIGVTNDIAARLKKHNTKVYKNAFTSRGIPWELKFTIEDLEKHQAFAIEHHIKQMHSRKYLEDLLQYPEMVDRLVERFRKPR